MAWDGHGWMLAHPLAEETMDPESIRLVRMSFAELTPVSDLVANLFYERLFTLEPSLRLLFAEDMGRQKRALMATLQFAVDHLDNEGELLPAVEHLGIRHASYGVVAEHYRIVGSALLWTLERSLALASTPEVLDAWAQAYEVLASTMQLSAAIPKA